MTNQNNDTIKKEFDLKIAIKDKEAQLLKLMEIEKDKIEQDAKNNFFGGTLAV